MNFEEKKPQVILDIEQEFETILTYSERFDDSYYSLVSQSYSLNEHGEVASLVFGSGSITDLNLISKISSLELLEVQDNEIEDISPLSVLKKLEALYVGGNRITDISPLITLSGTLKRLVLWHNPVRDISPLGELISLRELFAQGLEIEDLSFTNKLVNIVELCLDYNSINDIVGLGELGKLRSLMLRHNKISLLPVHPALLRVEGLDIGENSITEIHRSYAEKFGWLSSKYHYEEEPGLGINLNGNPLEFPPPSVIQSGPNTVENYYQMAGEFGDAPLSEGRIIVIGDGSAGKSSLIEKVLYNTFEKGKKQTNGIKIENWEFPFFDGRPLTFHIWDFGGQEIQHAVHKFFFTEGCLYVLVLDNRKEEEPEYWLQQIESLGGGAPVLVVFNKQDENASEIADRKFLKEKYPSIVSFYKTSCVSGFGIDEFKKDLERETIKLRTVHERLPNNWFNIKRAIEERTTGSQHYLSYEVYQAICKENHAETEEIQKLLLKYFTTIGVVTWFGDTYLNFMHVLSPAWITQGVYRIITSKKTAKLYGQISIDDFKELLYPADKKDFTYDENHYGYILSMMKKFDLCYAPDDKNILIPSAFGKEPRLEYREFRGEGVSTYILQFKDYMPPAIIHRFIAKNLSDVFESNYWYSGIVVKDSKSDTLSMVHADKEAKRIYVRIKGDSKLGMWEHIRRDIDSIASSYANIVYSELMALDEKSESTVDYDDLLSHIKARKAVFFHPKLRRDFNVGYLMGLFEDKGDTLEKFKSGVVELDEREFRRSPKKEKVPPFVVNILNNNSPTVSTNVNTQITIDVDIDITVVQKTSSSLRGDADYLLSELGEGSPLADALTKTIQFAEDAKKAQNSGDVVEKGWGKKLKGVINTLSDAGGQLKNISEGKETLQEIFANMKELAAQFDLVEVVSLLGNIPIGI
ncbi:MAG: COR domain-containing protein [Imperialibacter sp.]|uniref:COR domain-containing protein n=1 Tax=Imperialibacter sp. TaxID=2038411 RepID=UPI003A879728